MEHLDILKVGLSKWFEKVGVDARKLAGEDVNKDHKLMFLNKTIGMPINHPTIFEITDVLAQTDEFRKFAEEYRERTFGLRLSPKGETGLVLRNKYTNVKDAVEWIKSLDINFSEYKALFKEYAGECVCAAVFVVNEKGILGEALKDSLNYLITGSHTEAIPFSFDFNSWKFAREDSFVEESVKAVIEFLKVNDHEKQQALREKLNATFANDYLQGYFEIIRLDTGEYWFIDYNRFLGKYYENISLDMKREGHINGHCASPGKVSGKVKILSSPEQEINGEIVVTELTTPNNLHQIRNAAAIITNKGGILSHAAIVCREIGKPCIVGTGNATEILQDGQEVEVDAESGTVRLL